jgi:anti-sigma factor (TIGR02949 family)
MRRRRGDPEATCAEVARVLQSYLDGQVDEMTARRVARHLDACRRCGLEARTYEAIKEALARQRTDVDAAALEGLRSFGERLVERVRPTRLGRPPDARARHPPEEVGSPRTGPVGAPGCWCPHRTSSRGGRFADSQLSK